MSAGVALTVCTARVTYGGPDRLDVTRKGVDVSARAGQLSAGAPFAPSWELLRPALDARALAEKLRAGGRAAEAEQTERASWLDYLAGYRAEMRASWRAHRPAWDGLIARESVTLVCYCADVRRCHRGALAQMVLKAAAHVGREARYGGDWRPCDECDLEALHQPATMFLCGRRNGSARAVSWWPEIHAAPCGLTCQHGSASGARHRRGNCTLCDARSDAQLSLTATRH